MKDFRADLIVEKKVIVELKCVEKLNNAHKKQLLTYLRLTGIRLGYLMNFSEALMKHGITRTVNRLVEKEITSKYLCALRLCEMNTAIYSRRRRVRRGIRVKTLVIF